MNGPFAAGIARSMRMFRVKVQFTCLLLVGGMAWIAAPYASASEESAQAQFVGSARCQGCHAEAYKGWKETRMANVVRDPKEHPEAVLGDFVHGDPARTF